MTQEDKELLFKDISARLPYGVKCNVYERIGVLVGLNDYGAEIDYGNGEYNEFHRCVDYDGTINTDSLIKDLKNVFK